MIAHFEICDDIIYIINKYYNKNIHLLITIYEDGICLTQNINSKCNLNFFIPKNKLSSFLFTKKYSIIINCEANNFKNCKIETINDKVYLNNRLCNLVISQCNFCENISNIKENISIDATNDLIKDIDLGWLNKIIKENINKSKFIYNDNLNGFYIKIIEK